MKKVLTVVLVLVAALSTAMAQNATDPVVFEIDGKPVYKSEFMKNFLHSIGKDPAAAPTACTYEKRQALEEYVRLYVNFRAKLADAYALGYDTMASLCKELKTYRDELSGGYLIDSATMWDLLHEAYERNQYVLHAAHILVPCAENALPEDTVAPYQHAMELYNRAVAGEDFYALAGEEMRQQRSNNPDPTVRQRADQINPTEGDLGCFTVFDMIYPFESAVYSMQPGEVHKPVRTIYGYHIIKLFERHKYYGKVTISHIWISDKDANASKRIRAAYEQLQGGEDFAKVAKNYSSDRGAGSKGSELTDMPCNQLPTEYIAAIADGMKPGDISKPFQSRYGWHIIKLIAQEEQPPFESMVPYYKSKMNRGERSKRPQHVYAEQCKERYGFEDYTTIRTSKKKNAPYAASLAAVRAVVTDTIFSAKFNYDSNQITDMRPLFRIGEKKYDSRDFARYLRQNRRVWRICDLDVFVADRYKDFIEAAVISYADERLEEENPEFRDLVEEYRHGLMIFAYNDRFIWGRAIKDTAGFAQFYEMAMPKHDIGDTAQAMYFWGERALVNVYSIFDSNCIAPEKAIKVVKKCVDKGTGSGGTRDALLKKLNQKRCRGENPVTVKTEVVEKEKQDLLLPGEWHKGIYTRPNGWGYKMLVVEKLIEPEAKSLKEARGYYLNDYQNYLEQEVSNALREKYHVVVHQDVVDEITY